MTVFGSYARYYDLLYRDKDYSAEAAFAAARLREQAPGTRRLLELGSGTGAHALELARMGFEITGVDLSADMVARAQARRETLEPPLRARLRFMQGDARTTRLAEPFDAVIALFHVLSYQTRNTDVSGLLGTAAAHLRPGGLFFFDFWYGPAVLSERPEVRVKRLQVGGTEIIRTAEPTLRENDNCVDVRYTVRSSGPGGDADPVSEAHAMRYFFLPELDMALDHAGLERLSATEMPSGAALGTRTWSACILARKR